MKFKGTKVGIFTASLETNGIASLIKYEAGFLDDEGVVHGLMTHQISVNATPGIESAVTQLIKELTVHATSAHFTGAPASGSALVSAQEGGLSAALGNGSVLGRSDEPGEEGF